MFDRNERKVGLGWTAEGGRVVAHVSVEEGKGISQYMDHTQAADPDRVSVSFQVIGGGSEQYGQVPSEDRVIARRHENDASPELAAFIDELWTVHHLNDMHAECDHMTPDMLARLDGESTQDWQTRMLDTVVCPESGYKWGRAWLARTVPADTLAKARTLVNTGRI